MIPCASLPRVPEKLSPSPAQVCLNVLCVCVCVCVCVRMCMCVDLCCIIYECVYIKNLMINLFVAVEVDGH